MNSALAFTIFAHAAFTPVKAHVDGAGYMRFIRGGRVVYAKSATFVVIDGDLASEGAKVLPEIQVPSGAQTLQIDLQGNVQAGGANLGRLVLAIFPSGSTSSTTDSFFSFEERPTLVNPGDDTAGVIRVDGDPTPPIIGHAGRTPAPRRSRETPQIHADRTEPPTRATHASHKSVGAEVEVIVRLHSEVPGNVFSVGDIATVTGPDDEAGAFRKVEIGTTTIAGFTRVIDPKYVALRLRGAGHPEGSYVLVVPDGADVARKCSTVTADEITQAAITAAQVKVGSKIPFLVNGAVRPIVADFGDLKIDCSDPEQTNKGYTVVVTGREGNTIVGAQTVSLVVPGDIAGVKVGDTVKVVLKAGSAMIEVEGRALSNGYVGQKVKVTITASPNSGVGATTTHTATVVDAGRVEVDL